MAIVISNYMQQATLARLVAAAPGAADAGILFAPKLMVFKEAASLSPQTVIADLVEADYAGYARLNIGFNPVPYVDAQGGFSVWSYIEALAPTDALDPQLIYGYAVLNTAATQILFSESFAEPVALNSPTTALQMTVQYSSQDTMPNASVQILV